MTSSAACSFSACSRVHLLTGSVAGAYHHQPGPQAPAFSAIGGNSQAWTLEEPKRQPAGQGQPAGAGSGPQLQARPPGPCHIICCPLTWDRCVCLGTGHAVMLRRSFGQLPGLSAAPPQGVPGAVLGCLTAPNFLARCLHVPEASGAPSRSRRRRCRPTPGLCSMCMQTVAPHGCPQAQGGATSARRAVHRLPQSDSECHACCRCHKQNHAMVEAQAQAKLAAGALSQALPAPAAITAAQVQQLVKLCVVSVVPAK